MVGDFSFFYVINQRSIKNHLIYFKVTGFDVPVLS